MTDEPGGEPSRQRQHHRRHDDLTTLTIHINKGVADWALARAKERNLGVEHTIETALMKMRTEWNENRGLPDPTDDE